MRPQGIPEDYIKIKEFPFSLDRAAKDWLYLHPVLFNTWGDMKLMFLEKFFLASKTMTIGKETCGIRQQSGETLHEYWEKLNKLCTTCRHHQINEQLLIQCFYEGLSMMERSMIDVASEGALMDKTPTSARHLISNMASNTQQFGIRGPTQSWMVNKIGIASNMRLEKQLSELTSLVRQHAVGQHQPNMAAKVCSICTFVEHPTDLYPTLQESELNQPENVGAINGYQYRKQPYQNWPLDNQQYGRQPFWPGPNQGPYAAQRFGPTPNVPQGSVAKYGRHHPRPQDATRTVSQHYEPFTVGRIQQPSLTNNSESEREHECSYTQRWKITISTSIAATEINRSRLRTGCQLSGAITRENCPITISNSDRLGKEIRV
ncbi:hypothetical protein CR513_47682, partial [Mucuna pruriens]